MSRSAPFRFSPLIKHAIASTDILAKAMDRHNPVHDRLNPFIANMDVVVLVNFDGRSFAEKHGELGSHRSPLALEDCIDRDGAGRSSGIPLLQQSLASFDPLSKDGERHAPEVLISASDGRVEDPAPDLSEVGFGVDERHHFVLTRHKATLRPGTTTALHSRRDSKQPFRTHREDVPEMSSVQLTCINRPQIEGFAS